MNYHIKSGLVKWLSIALVGVAVLFLVWFGFLLHLRNDYNNHVNLFNNAIVETASESVTISRGEETYPVTELTINTIDKFLHDGYTTAYNRKRVTPDGGSVTLDLNGLSLVFTELKDEKDAFNIAFLTPSEAKYFSVRGQVNFRYIKACFDNERRRMSQ